MTLSRQSGYYEEMDGSPQPLLHQENENEEGHRLLSPDGKKLNDYGRFVTAVLQDKQHSG